MEPIILQREEDMPYQSISLGSMEWNRTGSWRYLRPRFENKVPPCNEGCPAGQDIEGAMVLIGRGKYLEAWDLLKEENPLPGVCGRVCYHPCQSACNRKDFDEAVAIHVLERFVADCASKQGRGIVVNRERRKEKMAVIGSGPAGLSCAYHLARMGYGVTLFEALPVLGGMLRVGIPEYRLPKTVLEGELDQILELGVRAEMNTRLGKDFFLGDLKEYQAIFLATGNHKSKSLGIPGEETKGVISGLDFLREVSLGRKKTVSKRVAVIGGGNTAMDAARSALRLGARPVILYRRTREEMPAFPDEVGEAEEEGIEISFLTSPVRILSENGKVSALECVKNRLGPPDEDGRRRPVEMKDSHLVLPMEEVILAIGEESDLGNVPQQIGAQGKTIPIDERGATPQEGIFAGGDIVSQPHTVVHAIGSGKRAAIFMDGYARGKTWEGLLESLRIGERGNLSMKRYLQGASKGPLSVPRTVLLKDLNVDYFEPRKRSKAPKGPISRRINSFEEVNLGFSEEGALEEAGRCFNCGVCNLCDNCYIFCPDAAITRSEGDDSNTVNYDYCKGCGICVEECPRDAIVMEEEEK
jgi:2-oxoacid:acceptor oxidoreductase delta subunit (pyruvate/2-ketoisovalerate family)